MYGLLGEKGEEKSKEGDNRSNNFQSTTTGRRGSLQLWQFLVALLDAPDASAGCIAWTGRGMEFKLIEPEEVGMRQVLLKGYSSICDCTGGKTLGSAKESARYELRQIEQIFALLLREGNYAESGW